jgi:hypothetical protein
MANHAERIFNEEMDLARICFAEHQWAKTTYHLERAHIVGQRYFFGHLITHLWMLRMAWVRRDLREAIGQFIRILAVPLGFFFGWVPVGNTGGAKVSPILPMPIPPDLQICFVGYSLRRQILWRLALYITVLLVAWWLSAPWKAVSSSLATNGTQSLSSGLEPVAFGNT